MAAIQAGQGSADLSSWVTSVRQIRSAEGFNTAWQTETDSLCEQEGTAANASSDMVSAFAQSNVGDTSPNTQGAFCQDTGVTLVGLQKGGTKKRAAAPTRIRTGVS